MLLGGLRYLIPVIKEAKKLGLYVITSDYVPSNIAHKFSDENHNVDITDKEAVLKLAKKLKIDGIMSFAVDPGVLTAAYVAEELGLPTCPYSSVEILQDKGLFRNFLADNNFNVPFAKSFSNIESMLEESEFFPWPLIIKPVDAAGSKGVKKVNTPAELFSAAKYAMSFSQSNKIIVEEFLEAKGFSSDSDCFSVDNVLNFVSFSSQRFDNCSKNPFTPAAYSWPSSISPENQKVLILELQRLIKLLKLGSSIYNIEVREDKKGIPYIMEVSPRGGGNRLSEMVHFSTGTDLIQNAIKVAIGEKPEPLSMPTYKGNWAELILYSNQEGKFSEVIIDESVKKYVFELDLWVKKGDIINSFEAANDAVGTLVFNFDSQVTLEKVLGNSKSYVELKLNENNT